MGKGLNKMLEIIGVSKEDDEDFDNTFEDDEEEDATPEFKFPKVPEYSKKEKLKFEKDVTGLYLSDHPMKEYAGLIEAYGTRTIASLFDEENECKDGDKVSIMGILAKVTKKLTRNETMMAILQLQDLTGTIEVLLFSKTYEKFQSLLVEDKVVIIEGRLSIEKDNFGSDDDESDTREIAKLMARNISEVDRNYSMEEVPVSIPDVMPQAILAMDVLRSNPGKDMVYFHFTDAGKKAKFQQGVDLSDGVCSQIYDIVGRGNTVMKEVAV